MVRPSSLCSKLKTVSNMNLQVQYNLARLYTVSLLRSNSSERQITRGAISVQDPRIRIQRLYARTLGLGTSYLAGANLYEI
jgi:hypothetical protein